MSHKPYCSTKAAFTLIELLVVIAIIAVLAAILFPVFSRARENARKASCASNLKQLGLAFVQYTQDYDGRYPGAGQYQKWAAGSGHWVSGVNSDNLTGDPGSLAFVGGANAGKPRGVRAGIEAGALYTYVKNAQVYRCPSNSDGEPKGLTYSMNCAVAGITDSALIGPTDTILLVDEERANDGYFYAVGGSTSTDAITQMHNGGANLLLCDGHVKFYPFARLPIEDNSAPGSQGGAYKTRKAESDSPRFWLGPSYTGSENNGFGSCVNPNS